MKLTAVILLLACMTASATGFSQITISESNAPLAKVLKKIKKQSGYNFLVRYQLIKDALPVSVKLKDATLQQAIKEILKGQSLVYEVIDKTVIIRKMEIEKKQDEESSLVLDIRGRIVNEKGEPMGGVSIMLKGTSKGSITDANGEFVITGIKDKNAVLVVSYSGYQTQEVRANASETVNVRMMIETTEISTVIVTALGVKKEKKALSFSVQELGMKDLAEVKDVSVANYLTGKIAGAQISRTASGSGGSTKVIIRGVSSLTGENQPLYVVDGIPLDNSRFNEASDGGGNRNASAGHDFGDGISNINPQDIESISVLKGPNATALYGSRGSNGVILITTKSGKATKGIGIEVNSGTTLERVSMVPNVQNKYGQGYDDDATAYFDPIVISGVSYDQLDRDVASFGPELKGQLVVNPFVFDPNAAPTTFALLPQPKNNIRDFWETGVVTNNTVALSGGTDKSTARLSFNNITTKGITPNHKANQQIINLRAGTKVGSKLSFDAKINYVHKDVKNTPNIGAGYENVLWALTELNRYVPLPFLKEYYERGGRRVYFPGVRYNPYYIVNELKNSSVRDRIISLASVKYQFKSWLSLTARTGIDGYSERRRQTWPVGAQTSQSAAGRIIDESYMVRENNSDVLLTAADNNLGKFSATLSLGGSLLKRSNRLQGWDANTFKVPGVYDISNATNTKPYYSIVEKELQSIYAAGQIGYNNYLFVDITGRNDWSSTLGSNNYSFFYPSIGTSFVFTDVLKLNPQIP